MRSGTALLIAFILTFPLFAADDPQQGVPAATTVAAATIADTTTVTAAAFDFPRVARDQTRPRDRQKGGTRLRPLAPCGGCYCYTQCDNGADPDVCKQAPASHCAPFGSSEPCACGPCVCF